MTRRVLLALVLGLVVTACSDDGRELVEPDRPPTSPTTSTSPTTPAPPLGLSSPDFVAGGPIPATFTCDEADLSPALVWEGVPVNAAEVVIVVDDSDAENFVHWVLAGIPPFDGTLSAGSIPQGTVQATNSFGRVGWGGPCPPRGETHTYVFTLYALAEPLGLEPGLAGDEAVDLVVNAAFDEASTTGVYTRAG